MNEQNNGSQAPLDKEAQKAAKKAEREAKKAQRKAAKANKDPNDPNGNKDNGKKVFIALLVAIAIIVAAALVVTFLSKRNSDATTDDSSISSEDSIQIGDSKTYDSENSDGTLTGVEIAEKVKPSVIGIEIYYNGTLYGEGSGVVMSVDEDTGTTYVLTCAHLLTQSGATLQVQTEDGTAYDATIIGYDTRTDIGVVSCKTTDLTAAEFGDSTVLQVGEPVYAIGNPGGSEFYGSVTSGIVSALNRMTSSSDSGYTQEVIQHDAAINPGNSGGALVNSYGQVIGINSSKISETDYEGMGFAVPIDVAKDVVDSILANGYVTNRAKLGIQYVAVSQQQTYSAIAKMNDLPAGSIIIASINSESAFTGTDVEAGDIIIAVDGKDMDSVNVLLNAIEAASPGDKLTLTIAHVTSDYKVETEDVTVTLIEDKGDSTTTTNSNDESSGGFTNPFSGGDYGSGNNDYGSGGYGFDFGN